MTGQGRGSPVLTFSMRIKNQPGKSVMHETFRGICHSTAQASLGVPLVSCPTCDAGVVARTRSKREGREGKERACRVMLLSVKFHLDDQEKNLLDSSGQCLEQFLSVRDK